MRSVFVLGLLALLAPVAGAQIVITEWMYNGLGSGNTGEFVEFTNIGTTPIDMTGWSFDDDSRVPGTFSLSAFGVVAPGQSVILTDETAADFATIWGLTDVTIIGGNTANIGRNDEINLFDAADNLVDRLTYGDEDFPGTVRTQNRSCNIPPTDYAFTEAQVGWLLAVDGDAYGSKVSTRGEVAGPGRIVGYARSDFDRDGDVDLADFEVYTCCQTGPAMPYDPLPTGCTLNPGDNGRIAADADEDGDVDLADFRVFQLCFSGAGNPADPLCGREPPGPVETYIVLNGDSITVNGSGVTVDGTRATITSQGTYHVTGTLPDGQLVVNSTDGGVVQVLLEGVDITNSTTAPFNVVSAGYVSIVLADQSQNYLTDPSVYIYEDPNEDEPNAALFSKDSLSISGTGTLTVQGNYNDAIASKDELLITGGTLNVTAVDDGIRGKDYLLIQGGSITVTSGGDALKSDNDEDPLLGYITIEDGDLQITAAGDGLAAETAVNITGGDFNITCGGGHTATLPADWSAKGIKGLVSVVIGNGTFSIDAADDAIHSNDAVTIDGGTFTIATGDDGIHADNTATINGGTITVTASYEGLEAADIYINDGTIRVTSSDDGINGAGGDGSGGPWPPPPGDHWLYIHGGYIVVNAAGDGIDVNGSIVMTGGTVIVHGPTSNMNGALDFDGTFNISGGFLVAAGSANMAQAPSTSSTQRSVKITYNSNKTPGTLVHIETTTGGTDLLTFAPSKTYRSVVFSAPTLTAGLSCRLYRAGSSTGTVVDGLYQGGTYTPGTLTNTFTTNSIVTNVNAP